MSPRWVMGLAALEPAVPDEVDGRTTSWLRRLCGALVRELDVSGAAVALVGDDGLGGVAAASDPVTGALLAEQFSMGEGPAVAAHETRRPVLEADVAAVALQQWPAYAAAESRRSVRAEYAVPLQVGAARLGVLSVVADHPRVLDAHQLRVLLTFSEVAVDLLLDGHERLDAGAEGATDDVVAAVDESAVVYQAQGVVMVDLGVPLATAMVRLRAHAFATGRPVADVAADVVAGRLRLRPDAAPDAAPDACGSRPDEEDEPA